MIKYFRFSWHYVMWGISYTNLMMLMATIPVIEWDDDDDEKGTKQKKPKDIMEVESFEELADFLKLPKHKN